MHAHDDLKASVVRIHIVTVSDTRNLATDESGPLLERDLQAAGFQICARSLIPDDLNEIRSLVQQIDRSASVEAVILTGGTGLQPRDQTIEAITPLLHKHLEGFGEEFRRLSFEQIGARAMLSRAVAGVTGSGTLIFAIPGSKKAVHLAAEKIMVPVLSHAAFLAAAYRK